MVIVPALAGMVAGWALSWTTPARYLSSAVVRIPASDSSTHARLESLPRASLRGAIEEEGLYQRERAAYPISEVQEKMRGDFDVESHDGKSLCGRRGGTTGLRALVNELPAPGLVVVEAPSLPWRPESPTRPEMLGTGLAGGLLTGLLAAALWRNPRFQLAIGAAVAGAMLAAAVSLALPEK